MRRISLDHRQIEPTTEDARSSGHPSRGAVRQSRQKQRESLAPKPAAQASSLLAGVEERFDAENASDFCMDECEAETADNIPASDTPAYCVQISPDAEQSNAECSPEPEPEPKQSTVSKKKPATGGSKARRRMREDIDTNGIERVLEQAASRMTRSMARMAGGVQPPRRYFGEGVSTSQILRTKHEQ
ncbi:hypothetical protein IW150_001371 [Coemansia sp. RSA 2607]|nr:hypothetical protein IW150_001371 [Coemansia sp. RSA 2607]